MYTFDCEEKVNIYLFHVLGCLTIKIFGFSAWFIEGEKAKKEKSSEIEPFAAGKHVFS